MKDGTTARTGRDFPQENIGGKLRRIHASSPWPGRIRGNCGTLSAGSKDVASDASVDLQFLQRPRVAVLKRADPIFRLFPWFRRLGGRISESAHDWHGSCNKESQPNAAESTQSAACSHTATAAPHATVANRVHLGT
jgi:hypothetical protein